MAPDDARESSAFADADHVYFVVGLELVGEDTIARFEVAVGSRLQAEFALELHAFGARLLEMSRFGFGDAGFLGVLHQPELHGVVAVGGRRLALYHDAGASLENRDGHYLAV